MPSNVQLQPSLPDLSTPIDRRTVVGAAWALPVIAVVSAAPAHAASLAPSSGPTAEPEPEAVVYPDSTPGTAGTPSTTVATPKDETQPVVVTNPNASSRVTSWYGGNGAGPHVMQLAFTNLQASSIVSMVFVVTNDNVPMLATRNAKPGRTVFTDAGGSNFRLLGASWSGTDDSASGTWTLTLQAPNWPNASSFQAGVSIAPGTGSGGFTYNHWDAGAAG